MKMSKHSSSSMVTERFHFRDREPVETLRFHAQPSPEKQPVQRSKVITPKKKKTPPLMKWAKPLKIWLPC